MRQTFLFACLATMALSLLSLTDSNAQQTQIRTYTVGDGLSMNRVRGFYQDKSGFIWIYTWDGLSRYEAYRFRNYLSGRELRHSFVNGILETDEGTMYLALNDGSLALLQDEVVERITIPGDIINGFCRDEAGNVFVATDYDGIQELRGDTLVPYCAANPLSTIVEVMYYDKHFFFIGPYAGPSGVLDAQMHIAASWEGPPAYFNALYKDHADRIYVCTAKGLKEVDMTSAFQLKEVAEFPQDAPWTHWQTTSVIVTSGNDFWIGTNQGLVHLGSDGTWKVLTVQNGLLSNQVNALFEDASHTLWIGTDAGVASINLQTTIDDNRDLPGVYCNFILPASGGHVFAVTGHSDVHVFDRHLQRTSSSFIGQNVLNALGTRPDNRSLLLIEQKALLPYIPKSDILPISPLADPGVYYTVFHDKYWVASGLILQCSDDSGDLYPVIGSPDYTSCLTQKGEDIIIGSLEDGVFIGRLDESSDTCRIRITRDLSTWTEDDQIRSLFVSKDGALWIGTRYGGLVRLLCNEDFSHCTKQEFTIHDGLVSNWITSLAEDTFGNIWVGSASGLDKLVPRGDSYFPFPFSRTHGFFANVRHLVIHPDGSLWVGHNEGLARIIDGRIDTMGAPRTYLTEVTLGGSDFPVVPSHDPVHLRYDQNSVHFAFTAPDYVNTSQNTFTYRLLTGKDTSWSAPVKINEIFYGSLMPGSFTFEVAAYGWNGDRGRPVSYAFRIARPFWKQPWFIAFLVLLTGGIFFMIYRMRIAQLRRVHAVRDRIAADLHDDIGSTLTHINILSEIGRREYPRETGASDLFERIGSEVQTSSEALDDIIWSIRTRRDAIGDVIARMRQYAHELFEPAGITFQLHEAVDENLSLEMEFKRDFYLVFKELLRNVVEHAEASHVEVRISVEHTRVRIYVKDNGKGFHVGDPSERSGLVNVRARAQKWQGLATWISEPRSGTEVIVDLYPA